MLVMRKILTTTSDIQIGDQVTIDSNNSITATCKAVRDGKAIFMFDQCIAERKMNKENTNRGGFECSDLNTWLQNDLLPTFPEQIRDKIICLRLPTYGEIFGHKYNKDFYDNCVVPDNDEQFDGMGNEKECIRTLNGETWWYWLSNPIKEEKLSSHFACVDSHGHPGYYYASDSAGVCTVFEVEI